MQTECTSKQLSFEHFGRREVAGRFDGGWLTSDGGVLLLREADQLFDVSGRLARCFDDYRDPGRTEHGLAVMLAQRVMGLALGYEDLNDHDRVRTDAAPALASGRADVVGAFRVRARDRGHALAGSSTLNRMELGRPEAARTDRYKRIVADGGAIDRLLVALFLEAHETPPEEIVQDLDATDDPLHGAQEGRFFHGYYDCHCYLPLYIVCGEHVLCARLRPSDIDAPHGWENELPRMVAQIRAAWPRTRILLRGDSGFCREPIMAWCEAEGLGYVFGLARNPRLRRRIDKALRKSQRRSAGTGRASRRFRELRYRTLKSWGRTRRVVAKAEWLPGADGANPRFVAANLGKDRFNSRALYEKLYCARGDMENRIKDRQMFLFADRTSTATLRANQLRLYFSVFAGVLVNILRRVGLRATALADARPDTIRVRLLKIAARVRITVRRLRLSFASAFPLQDMFRTALASLRAATPRAPPG